MNEKIDLLVNIFPFVLALSYVILSLIEKEINKSGIETPKVVKLLNIIFVVISFFYMVEISICNYEGNGDTFIVIGTQIVILIIIIFLVVKYIVFYEKNKWDKLIESAALIVSSIQIICSIYYRLRKEKILNIELFNEIERIFWNIFSWDFLKSIANNYWTKTILAGIISGLVVGVALIRIQKNKK